MRILSAFLWDAFCEAKDTRMFQVLAILVGAGLAVLLSIGYEEEPYKEAIRRLTRDMGLKVTFEEFHELERHGMSRRFRARVRVRDMKGTLAHLAEMEAFRWRIEHWSTVVKQRVDVESDGPLWRARGVIRRAAGNEEILHEFVIDRGNYGRTLAEYFVHALEPSGVYEPAARSLGVEPNGDARIEFGGETTSFHLAGAGRMSLLFGLWDFRLPISIARTVYAMEFLFFRWAACVGGVLIALIVTSGMMPRLMARGAAEFWLSRPVARWQIVLFRFLGGLAFIAPLGLLWIGGSFLIISFRSGYWNLWYLASFPILLLIYGVLFSLNLLFGTVTRSTLAALFLTLLFWGLSWAAAFSREWIRELPEEERPPAAVAATETAGIVLPRVSETAWLTTYFMRKSLQLDRYGGAEDEGMEAFSIRENFVHGVLYIAATLALTAWLLSRRDF